MTRAHRWLPATLLVVLLGAVAPSAWPWISTRTVELAPNSSPPVSLLDLFLEYPSTLPEKKYRVRRWGRDAGKAHGWYRAWDASGRIRVVGSFTRGVPTDRWGTYDETGAVLVSGHLDRSGRRHGLWREHFHGHGLEIDYDHGAIVRWRLEHGDGFMKWAMPPVGEWLQIELFGIGGSSGPQFGLSLTGRPRQTPVVIRPARTGSTGGRTSAPRLSYPIPQIRVHGGDAEGTWIRLAGNGELDSIGVMANDEMHGLWTFFGTDGEIIRQDVYRRGEPDTDLRRVRAPWYDLAAVFDPSEPIVLAGKHVR